MTTDPLALIEAHVAAIESLALADEGPLPAPPDLDGLTLDGTDAIRAQELLGRLDAAGARLAGMQTRVRGEIEGMRRPRGDARRPAPRTLDTSA